MAQERLSKQAKIRLLLLLVVGGVIGALASTTSLKSVQLVLVAVAACVGVYAGFTIRHALFPKPDGRKLGEPES